jgi:hypothetical protein
MQSAFSAGGDTLKTLQLIAKNKGKTGGEKSSTGYPPIPVIIPTTC